MERDELPVEHYTIDGPRPLSTTQARSIVGGALVLALLGTFLATKSLKSVDENSYSQNEKLVQSIAADRQRGHYDNASLTAGNVGEYISSLRLHPEHHSISDDRIASLEGKFRSALNLESTNRIDYAPMPPGTQMVPVTKRKK